MLSFSFLAKRRSPVFARPEHNQRSISAGLALAWTRDPLFDDLTAKVGVDLALFGPSNSFTQNRIRNPFFPGKATGI